jgi:hypothetical protein
MTTTKIGCICLNIALYHYYDPSMKMSSIFNDDGKHAIAIWF